MAVEAHSHAKRERSATSPSRPTASPLLVVADSGDAASADALALAVLLGSVTDGSVIAAPKRAMPATLLDLAARETASVIVMAAPQRGDVGRDWRQVSRSLRAAPCPVALAPLGYRHAAPSRLTLVGVAFDGWPEARLALAQAVDLARTTGAELRILMVGDPHTAASREPQADETTSLEGHAQAARDYLDRVVAELLPRLRARGVVLYGPVVAALAEAARTEGLNLLVIGSRRLGPAARVALGGVSSALAKRPPCPLLIVPRGVESLGAAGHERSGGGITSTGQGAT
jgi:nucleotide-binding universal stress UspA family protein